MLRRPRDLTPSPGRSSCSITAGTTTRWARPSRPTPADGAMPSSIAPSSMPATRRILTTGFIGRRRELHGLRRRFREGQRVFVFQGLGGLGKSTLALHMLREILHADDDLCALWCQDAETARRRRRGSPRPSSGSCWSIAATGSALAWEPVVQQVDQEAGVDPARRFAFFLSALLQSVDRLVVYLDNLESLLVGPRGHRWPGRSGRVRRLAQPALKAIWSLLTRCASDTGKLHIVASCRYRNVDFRQGSHPRSRPYRPMPCSA